MESPTRLRHFQPVQLGDDHLLQPHAPTCASPLRPSSAALVNEPANFGSDIIWSTGGRQDKSPLPALRTRDRDESENDPRSFLKRTRSLDRFEGGDSPHSTKRRPASSRDLSAESPSPRPSCLSPGTRASPMLLQFRQQRRFGDIERKPSATDLQRFGDTPPTDGAVQTPKARSPVRDASPARGGARLAQPGAPTRPPLFATRAAPFGRASLHWEDWARSEELSEESEGSSTPPSPPPPVTSARLGDLLAALPSPTAGCAAAAD